MEHLEDRTLLSNLFSSSFGNQDTDDVASVDGWVDGDGPVGQDCRIREGGPRPGSPTEQNARLRLGCAITKTVNTSGFDTVHLLYSYRKDENAEASDLLKVFVDYGSGDVLVDTRALNPSTPWNDVDLDLSTITAGAVNNTTIIVKFQGITDKSDEQATFDDVGVTATQMPNTIYILKDTVPDDPQDFNFTEDIVSAGFTLDDDPTDGTFINFQLFTGVGTGTFTVTEAAASGFDTTLLCTFNGSATGSPTTSTATGTASITITSTATDSAFCTYTNTKHGTITIIKNTDPDNAQDFSFTHDIVSTPSVTSPFFLDDDADGTLSNTQTFLDVPAGTYTVTEAAPVAPWVLSNLSCSDPSGGTSKNLTTRTVSIGLAPGEAVTCTFTNAVPGTINIIKDADPDSPQDFSFTHNIASTPTVASPFLLDDDSDGTLSNTQTFLSVLPATYTVTEADPTPAFDLTNLDCDDDLSPNPSTVSLSSRKATIKLDSIFPGGETVTCTFTNTARGMLTIVKDAIPDDPQDFSFTSTSSTSTSVGSFVLDDDGSFPSPSATPDTRTFGLKAGTYTVTEGAVAGWNLVDLSCAATGGSSGAQNGGNPRQSDITLTSGGTVNCTYTNHNRGAIIIRKDTNPDNAQDFSFTTTGGLSPATFSLDDDTNATLANFRSFLSLNPGDYTVTENDPLPLGFVLANLDCPVVDGTGTTASTDFATRTVNIHIENNGLVECLYTDAKPGKITIVKQALGGDDTFDFDTTGAGLPTSFGIITSLGPSVTFLNIPPDTAGGITVTEGAMPAGWDFDSVLCVDSDTLGTPSTTAGQVATINLDPSEEVTCTFINKKHGTVIIEKAAQGGDDTFTFTSVGSAAILGSFNIPTVAGAGSRTFLDVPSDTSGTIQVTESPPPLGWDFTNLVCVDGDTASSVNTTTRVATINLDPGETVTCTYTNTKRGTITIFEDTVPNSAKAFTFNTTSSTSTLMTPSPFTLDDNGDETTGPGPASNRQFTDLKPGNYTVTVNGETDAVTPNTHYLRSLTCTTTGGSVGTQDANNPLKVNITLTPGDSVACTFVHTRGGQIEIFKATEGGNDTFIYTTIDSFTNVPIGAINTGRLPGSFNVTTTAVNEVQTLSFGAPLVAIDSYTLTFSGGSGPQTTGTILRTASAATVATALNALSNIGGIGGSVTVTGVPGVSYTITFGGTLSGLDVPQLTLTRVSGTFAFTIATTTQGSPGTGSHNFSVDFLAPGLKTITEAPKVGWDFLAVTDCTVVGDGSSDGNPGDVDFTINGSTVTIDLDPLETVRCFYANRKQATVVVNKTALGGNDTFGFTGDGNVIPSSFSITTSGGTGSQTFANFSIPGPVNSPQPVSASVAENAPPSGWDLSSLGCTDPTGGTTVSGSTATLGLNPGDLVTCTFVNAKRGTVIINKVAQGGDATFNFAGTGTDILAAFGITTVSGSGSQTFANVRPGTKTVTETVPANWSFVSLTCSDPDSGTTVNSSTRTATIDLDPGETVTCTYTNTLMGTVVIQKMALGGSATFNYTGTGGVPNFSIATTPISGTSNSSGSQTYTLLNGTKTVTESAPPSGWVFTSLTCVVDEDPVTLGNQDPDPDVDFTIDSVNRKATINLDRGETVTCTYTNSKLAKVIILTNSLGGDATYSYTGTGSGIPASFNLTTAGGAVGLVLPNLVPGLKTVTETSPASPFVFTSLDCDDSDVNGVASTPAALDTTTRVSTIHLDPGETVTCKYTNSKKGTLIVENQLLPDGSAGTVGFTGAVTATLADNGTSAPLSIAPGTYTVTETDPAPNFDLSSITCNDANSTGDVGTLTATFIIDPGETVKCTFTNTKRGKIIVEKQTLPNAAVGSFGFTAETDVGPSFPAGGSMGSLSDGQQITVTGLPPGQYQVSEDDPTVVGYDLSTLVCDDGASATASTSDVPTRIATFNVDAGETVKCTFTNSKRGTIVINLDTVPNDATDFSFTGTGPSGFDFGGGFSLDDDADGTLANSQTFIGLLPGSYSLTQGVPASGFNLSSLVCVDPDSGSSINLGSRTATIDVDGGETITCTYTDRATLYFSILNNGSVGTLSGVANEDIVAWNGTGSSGFSLFFDGSDVGVGSLTLDAFAIKSATEILMSFSTDVSSFAGPGLAGAVDNSDIVLFTASSLGATTAGTFSMYFDGSDVDLASSTENVDAIELLNNGDLLLSTSGSFSVRATVPGPATPTVTGAGQDLIKFTPTALGATTTGSFSLYLKGSAAGVGLASSSENVNGVAIDSAGKLYLGTTGSFSVPGLTGTKADFLGFAPSSSGPITTGTYDSPVFFKGSTFGLGSNAVTDIDFPPTVSSLRAASAGPLTGGPTAFGTDRSGTINVFVDDSGSLNAEQQARVADAIAALNAEVAGAGMTLHQVDSARNASVVIRSDATSPCGSASEGVLGCTAGLGEITLIAGLNWYSGADAGAIGRDQYDFQTAVTHELSHALGLEHSRDMDSALAERLELGVVHRDLTAHDLAIIGLGGLDDHTRREDRGLEHEMDDDLLLDVTHARHRDRGGD